MIDPVPANHFIVFMETAEIAGFRLPVYHSDPGWIPESKIVLTETTLSNLKKILPSLLAGHNILLVGDAGVGKNALIYYINSIRKQPTIRYSFNEDTLPEDLVGSYRIHPATHGFVWSDGPLSRAIREGATFVADEMNLASPEVLKRFQSVFAEKKLQLLEGDASVLSPQAGFGFIATQNPAEGFEGRKNLPREIQKYFATIYMDSYPDHELVEILSGLYPDIPEKVLRAVVTINEEIEDAVIRKKIAGRDLERYHFNLRNLAKLARRIDDNPDALYAELKDIYQAPFRRKEDRELTEAIIAQGLIENDLQSYVSRAKPGIEIHASDKGILDIGRARVEISKDRSSTEQAFRQFAPVDARLPVLEAVARAVQFQENVLLESESDVEPDEYVAFFARANERPLSRITLSRGMHTSDVLGGLKPASDAQDGVEWVDGPLTSAIRDGDYVLIQGLEAAGPELVEKLNMLMDDARALVLPPESGETEPLFVKEEARLFAVKFYRQDRSTPTVSRAFRNRFTAITVDAVDDPASLRGIVEATLDLESDSRLVEMIQGFHTLIRQKAHKREIGSANLQPYRFGLTNLARYCEAVGWAVAEPENLNGPRLREELIAAAQMSYTNEISDPKERRRMLEAFEALLDGKDLDQLAEELRESKKKELRSKKKRNDKIWWNQDEHWRDANTGKAKWKLDGSEIKQGIAIDTPETGGQTKEGPDAWYGQDTQGNKGVGDPGHGGGAWGYRSEELYEEFLKKRKILWDYTIGASIEEFKEVFGPEIDRVRVDLDKLLDPDVQIQRRFQSHGSRVDARKYLSYRAGRGDQRVFDRTIVDLEQDKLKGLEVLFVLNKGRRIFNFEYSVATLVALMSAAEILSEHNIPFGVAGYSDLENDKVSIDFQWYKTVDANYGPHIEDHLFKGICQAWHGDTVPDASIMEEAASHYSSDARTRILVMLSDFRGARARVTMQKDLESHDTRRLASETEKLTERGLHLLGVGLGPRAIADLVFKDSLSIARENYANLPSLLATTISELIHRYHA